MWGNRSKQFPPSRFTARISNLQTIPHRATMDSAQTSPQSLLDHEEFVQSFSKWLDSLDLNKAIHAEKLNLIQDLISQKLGSSRVNTWMDGCSAASSILSMSSYGKPSTNDIQISCQFCHINQRDMEQLTLHLDGNCGKFKRGMVQPEKTDYSYFQILPNNSIKCNLCNENLDDLSKKAMHSLSTRHVSASTISRKAGTSHLFCSVCKISVPDNNFQFQQHIQSTHHQTNRNQRHDSGHFIKNGIYFLILEDDRAYCLICRFHFGCNFSDFVRHKENEVHKRKMRKRFSSQYQTDEVVCFVCNEPLCLQNCAAHLQTVKHMNKKKENCGKCVYCLFCNQMCDSLDELATHLTCSCRRFIAAKQRQTPALGGIKTVKHYPRNKRGGLSVGSSSPGRPLNELNFFNTIKTQPRSGVPNSKVFTMKSTESNSKPQRPAVKNYLQILQDAFGEKSTQSPRSKSGSITNEEIEALKSRIKQTLIGNFPSSSKAEEDKASSGNVDSEEQVSDVIEESLNECEVPEADTGSGDLKTETEASSDNVLSEVAVEEEELADVIVGECCTSEYDICNDASDFVL